MVEAAEADVVGPAVAADDPDGLAHQAAGQSEQVIDICVVGFEGLQGRHQARHALALGADLRLAILGGLDDLAHQARPEGAARAAAATCVP